MTHLEIMQKRHPGYGTEDHQRAFCARMDRMQELMPCPLEHLGHSTDCYPASVVETAVREQIAASKATK